MANLLRRWDRDELRAVADGLRHSGEFYPVAVPEGRIGKYAVSKFELTETGVSNLRYLRDGLPEFVVRKGLYTKLTHEEFGLLMSNTQMEHRTSAPFITQAAGHVLVSGLGLGMLLRPLLGNPRVTEVTVLERAQEVIDLVAPTYRDLSEERLRIIRADCYEWVPPKRERFDCAFHDIWSTVSPENLPPMQQLRKRYQRYMSSAGKQHCWSESICKRMQRSAA